MTSAVSSSWSIAASYRFTEVANPPALADSLRDYAKDLTLRGTLIVATEGFNGTLAADRRDALQGFFQFLAGELALQEPPLIKWSRFHRAPFGSFRVKVKPEIVTFRQGSADPRERVGHYLKPREWNQLLADDNVLTIDTRNDYEVEVGRFKGAIHPHTGNFTEFARFVREELAGEKDRPVAMYCTGGIRCEKATSFLLAEGFRHVYHLEGGILRYLEEIDPQESRWEGECFVFDERVAVDHQLEPSQRWKMDFTTGMPYLDDAIKSTEKPTPS